MSNNVLNFSAENPKRGNDQQDALAKVLRSLMRIETLLEAMQPNEGVPLSVRRERLARQMAVFKLKPSDYTYRELVAMGYHDRHIPSWKRGRK